MSERIAVIGLGWHASVNHLVYASSSSIYGPSTRMPFECPIRLTIRSASTPPSRKQTS